MRRTNKKTLKLVCVTNQAPRSPNFFHAQLNSVEHEILNAHKYTIPRNLALLRSDKSRKLFYPLINVKIPTIVGILTFMRRKNFMLS